jgi:hypothetical protein
MKLKRKPGPVSSPVTPPLIFRGLDLCDGCGARLEPGDRLSGLCETCQAPKVAGPSHSPTPQNRR